jgi:hypothetical protein
MAICGPFEDGTDDARAIAKRIVLFKVLGSKFKVQGLRFKIRGSRLVVQD